MIKKRFIKQNRQTKFFKINHYIHFPEVRVLSEHGEMIGVMSTSEAIQRAQEADKDLVLITENAQPPITKIIDLAKHKYQLQQKKAEGRKNSRKQDIKEVRFTPFIGEADFETRIKKIGKFLEKGDKVRITVEFKKGRQITKKDFGYEMFDKVFDRTSETADVEIKPKMIGKKLMAQLMPKKKAKKP